MKSYRRLELALTLCAALLLGVVGPASATMSWDLAGDFSLGGNPNGQWLYGSSPNLDSLYTVTAYAHMNTTDLAPLAVWTNGTTNFSNPSLFYNPTSLPASVSTLVVPAYEVAGHPGQNGEYTHAVWTAPETGYYLITSTFTGYDTHGTTTDVHVLVNGVSQFDGIVVGYGSSSQVSFSSGQLYLQSGDKVDFAVGMIGPSGDIDYNYDTTGITARITAVPLPATVLLMGTGLAGLGLLRRRKKALKK
jgi:hypothetical protein